MAITLTAITEAVMEALRDSTAILDKCQELFGAAPSIFVGYSGEEAPDPEYFPYFQLYPAIKVDGEAEDNLGFILTLELAIQDTTKTEATSGAGVYTAVFRGPAALEELLDLAVAAIREISEQLFVDAENTLYDPLEYFPLFVGVLTLTINIPKTAGVFIIPDL